MECKSVKNFDMTWSKVQMNLLGAQRTTRSITGPVGSLKRLSIGYFKKSVKNDLGMRKVANIYRAAWLGEKKKHQSTKQSKTSGKSWSPSKLLSSNSTLILHVSTRPPKNRPCLVGSQHHPALQEIPQCDSLWLQQGSAQVWLANPTYLC